MARTATPSTLWMLLAATLFLRALVPVGWMPDTGRTDVIVAKVCNADYVLRIPLNRDTKPEDTAGHQDGHCLFAGFSGDAPLASTAVLLALPPPVAELRIVSFARLNLGRIAYLLPPGRGPPATA
ncbi:hypothetical protein [Erythrobacter mangrovi]|uniref:DUF2946 family protein n=1 Tax=Erythrobacter mangrovi TaxID=2739433 RepID=A0A7D4CDZ2_9SPHN|nr:hypothetical protein [Erythrobacter mangrovi]QKG72089.1 hypothetical protein HQR01_12330 [Erythrobacter mangrovi]